MSVVVHVIRQFHEGVEAVTLEKDARPARRPDDGRAARAPHRGSRGRADRRRRHATLDPGRAQPPAAQRRGCPHSGSRLRLLNSRELVAGATQRL